MVEVKVPVGDVVGEVKVPVTVVMEVVTEVVPAAGEVEDVPVPTVTGVGPRRRGLV